MAVDKATVEESHFTIDEKTEVGKTPWVNTVFCPPELTKGDSEGRNKCYNNYYIYLVDNILYLVPWTNHMTLLFGPMHKNISYLT